MQCYFVGLFVSGELVGITLMQYLDLTTVASFGERDNCVKTKIRSFVFRQFSSGVLLVGNNMLTGQNALFFKLGFSKNKGLQTIQIALKSVQRDLIKKGIKVHLTIWKDFEISDMTAFDSKSFGEYYQFSTQPNMIFDIRQDWYSEQDYINALSKKYRDQYKRARKKSEAIIKTKLSLDDILLYKNQINHLYRTVADNAPFNTFYLHEAHFAELKKYLGDRFLLYGYFLNDRLIGFNTLIKNGSDVDTYFLGYDVSEQREKMLYLNMLYDMIAYSIKKGFGKIVMARTALEIKSSVGAQPIEMHGLIKHSNYLINKLMPKFFKFFEPEMLWKSRSPFK